MSSKLKDARWQLAEVMAADDGIKFYDSPYAVKQGYLDTAQRHLEEHGDKAMIENLAAEFNKEDS